MWIAALVMTAAGYGLLLLPRGGRCAVAAQWHWMASCGWMMPWPLAGVPA